MLKMYSNPLIKGNATVNVQPDTSTDKFYFDPIGPQTVNNPLQLQ